MTPSDPLRPGNMSSPVPHNANAGCPPATVWPEVAAGAISDQLAMTYLSHAAGCQSCSDLLAEALPPDLSDATPEEEALLQQLSTGTPEGQQRLAAVMFEAAQPSRKPRKTGKLFPWPILALAAAAALALAAYIAIPYLRPASDQQLLAKAYDHNRLSELRIPGSAAVDLASPTRGSGSAPVNSTELLTVKLSAQKKFEQTPNDPALRQTLGEIALVEHDGETARRQFEMAETLNPNLPHLKLDMASAYFVLAETKQHPLDYARSIDFYGQYLQEVHQQDPVALFDRGLCWERQSVNSEALKDFEAALALEKNAAWRREIQRHIDKLKAQSALDDDTTPYTPATLLALKTESPGDYENYLDAALREWLPHRTDPETAAAFVKLATLGAEHHNDQWLRDFLAAPTSPAADAALSQALQASAKGDADPANAASAAAIKLYSQANNQPGVIRARAQLIYSLQRKALAEDCLAQSRRVLADRELGRSSWLNIFLELEISSCAEIEAEHVVSIHQDVAAIESARLHALPVIGYRASGFYVQNLIGSGSLEPAWKAATVDIASSSGIRGTAMRRYQFLDGLEGIANSLRLNWTQAGLADAASEAAARTGNIQIAAYALEGAGVRQLGIRATAAATRNFDQADAELAKLDPGESAQLYRADWQADRSALKAMLHDLDGALAGMASEKDHFEPNNYMAIVNFDTEYADLFRQLHRGSDAIGRAWTAVQISERFLHDPGRLSQRTLWQNMTDRSYRMLTLSLADSDQQDAALRAWEWYRAAPFRAAETAQIARDKDEKLSSLPAIPSSPAGTLTLVYALLESKYVVWSIPSDTGQSIRMTALTALPSAIEDEGLALNRLCSDPHSSAEDIASLGRSLDRDLLSPFGDQIDRADIIQLDLDSSLAVIPFAVIQHGGVPLGLKHPLLHLPAGWPSASSNPSQPLDRADADRLPDQPSLLVIRETPPSGAALIPVEYDETSDIVERFHDTRVESARLARSGQSVRFSGTAALRSGLATADLMHYTGHGLDEGSDAPDRIAQSVVLTPGSMLRCRLAVLAACSTLDQRENITDNVSSFARVLLQAGSSHVLATQWDVDSRMTHQLMIRFYAELSDHQTFAEALRRAQKSLQSDPSASHPYFWSAFQLVGKPTYPARGKL